MPTATMSSTPDTTTTSASTNMEPRKIVVSNVNCGETKPSAREGHCSAVIGNKFYIFGGVSIDDEDQPDERGDLWCFDTDLNTWTQVEGEGEVPMSRSAATMCAVDNKLYLFGGLNQSAGWLDDFFVFDVETSTWLEEDNYSGRMPSSRDKVSSTVINKNIWYFGGFGPQTVRGPLDDEDESDESNDEIQKLESEQQAAKFGWFDDLFMYDTNTKTWSQPMQLSLGKPTPRCACTMNSYNDMIVIFGGRDSDGRTNDLHFFNTATRKWVKENKIDGVIPPCRSFHSASVIDNELVVSGGRGDDQQHFNQILTFSLSTYTWTHYNTSGFTARGCHTLQNVNGTFYSFGGSSDFDQSVQHCQKFYQDFLTFNLPPIAGGDGNNPETCSPSKKKKLDE